MIKTYWPLVFIVAVWIGFASPYFFQNKVPYPSTYQVDFFSPWSRYQGYDAPVKNNAMPDVITQIYPWKYFSIEQLKQGSLPFWNSNSFSGTPHIANYQSAVFSPFTILYFVLPFIDAWSIIILLQPLLAGIFLYLYLRKVHISQTGSLLGSIAFMFAGFMVVWMAYGTLVMAVVFLPLLLYLVEKYFEKKSVMILPVISIVTACSYFSGHFQTTIYIIGMTILYILYKSYTTQDKTKGIVTLLYIFLGVLLAMPQIIPTLEFYRNSVRESAYNSGAGIPFYNLITIIAPDFFGNPVTRNNKFLDYAEWQSFIGIIPLFLACCIAYKKGSRELFFLITAIAALILSGASPLQELVSMLRIPVISTSVQSRIIILFAFSLAVLSGFGYDALLAKIKKRKYKSIGIRIASFLLFLFVIWLILFFGKFISLEEAKIAQKNLVLPTLTFFIASVSIGIVMYAKNKIFYIGIGTLILGLVVLESFRFATKWMPFDPRTLVFPETKVSTYLQNNLGNQRIFGNVGGQMEIYYGLGSLDGYDSLYIRRYGELIASGPTGKLTAPVNRVVSVARVDKNTDRILNLLGVSHIFHPVSDTNAAWAYPVWNKDWMKSVYTDTSYVIYKNNDALPRAKMFYEYEVILDSKKSIQRFYTSSFDYKNVLLLEEKPPVAVSMNRKNVVDITLYTPNNIEITVETEKPGMLFLSDSDYPGWKAYVNDTETKIYRADYAFRAISLPAGKHKVRFVYIPMSFYIGCFLSFFALLSIILGCIVLRKWRKQRKAMQGT